MGLLPPSGWCDAHVPRRAEHPQELLVPAGTPCCPPTRTRGWLFSADQIDVFCFPSQSQDLFQSCPGGPECGPLLQVELSHPLTSMSSNFGCAFCSTTAVCMHAHRRELWGLRLFARLLLTQITKIFGISHLSTDSVLWIAENPLLLHIQ